MNLVKKYEKDNTISLALIDADLVTRSEIKNIDTHGCKGLLVITGTSELSQHTVRQIQERIYEILNSSDNLSAIMIPSGMKIEYIKF